MDRYLKFLEAYINNTEKCDNSFQHGSTQEARSAIAGLRYEIRQICQHRETTHHPNGEITCNTCGNTARLTWEGEE